MRGVILQIIGFTVSVGALLIATGRFENAELFVLLLSEAFVRVTLNVAVFPDAVGVGRTVILSVSFVIGAIAVVFVHVTVVHE